jgi:hypothetical protein
MSCTVDSSIEVLADFKGSLIVHGERQETWREHFSEDFTRSGFLFVIFLCTSPTVLPFHSQEPMDIYLFSIHDPH